MAPEFHTAFEVRVKDPHTAPLPRGLMEPASPKANLGGEDKGEAWEDNECDGWFRVLITMSWIGERK